MNDQKLITTILFAGLLAWGIWRRARRTFGRQPVQPARIWLRIGIFVLVGGLVFATSALRSTQALGALVAGLACGAALAYVGLRHTQFEVTPQGRFYTPHTYIGVAVIALFLGRLLYRYLYLADSAHALAAGNQNLALAYQRNPWTVGTFAVLVGYYLVFYLGVLVKTRPPSGLPTEKPT